MPRPPVSLRRRATLVAAIAAVCTLMAVPLAGWAASTRPVTVTDNAYQPADVTIGVGDTVRWVFSGDNPHSVTAPGQFDSHPNCGNVSTASCSQKGTTFSQTFTQTGNFAYFCRIHVNSGMTGVVRVTAEPPPPSPEPSPSASPSPSPSPTQTEPPPPSPTPTRTSTPRPSPSPQPSASPSSGPSGRPPGPSPTVEPSPVASPLPGRTFGSATPSPSFDPFPSARPSAGTTPDPLESPDVVSLPTDRGSGGSRTLPLFVASLSVAGAVGAFGRIILFGQPW